LRVICIAVLLSLHAESTDSMVTQWNLNMTKITIFISFSSNNMIDICTWAFG